MAERAGYLARYGDTVSIVPGCGSSDKNVYPPKPEVSLCDFKLGSRGIAEACQQTLEPSAFVVTASCLRASSTSSSLSQSHTARRHNRHGPAARTAQN